MPESLFRQLNVAVVKARASASVIEFAATYLEDGAPHTAHDRLGRAIEDLSALLAHLRVLEGSIGKIVGAEPRPKDPRDKLTELVETIRAEQTSAGLFGGPTGSRAEKARVYAAAIANAADQIDDVLDSIHPETP